jgi:hypothetical protein
MRDFAKSPEAPAALFRDAVLQLEAFSTFLQILTEFEDRGTTHLVLGRTLSTRLGHPWKDGTAAIVAKVLLDWPVTRALPRAPSVLAVVGEGPLPRNLRYLRTKRPGKRPS